MNQIRFQTFVKKMHYSRSLLNEGDLFRNSPDSIFQYSYLAYNSQNELGVQVIFYLKFKIKRFKKLIKLV